MSALCMENITPQACKGQNGSPTDDQQLVKRGCWWPVARHFLTLHTNCLPFSSICPQVHVSVMFLPILLSDCKVNITEIVLTRYKIKINQATGK